jgi:hypothetical protein
MGYTTIATGTVIATSWGNEVRDQLVTPFILSSTRDSTITLGNRQNGQVVALTNSDVDHGLTVWNGTSWTRPWNMPWGIVGSGTRTTNLNITSTTSADVTDVELPGNQYFTNRYYQAHINIPLGQFTGTAVTTEFYLTNGAGTTVIAALPRISVAASGSAVYSTSALFTISTVNQVLKLRYRQSGANAVIVTAGSADNASLVILDVGPSGAPA